MANELHAIPSRPLAHDKVSNYKLRTETLTCCNLLILSQQISLNFPNEDKHQKSLSKWAMHFYYQIH